MAEIYSTRFLQHANDYINRLSDTEQATLAADMQTMAQGATDAVFTKQLHGPIRELISGNHRITYFHLGRTIYFVDGFRKKSAKTPKSKIDFAKKVYSILNSKK